MRSINIGTGYQRYTQFSTGSCRHIGISIIIGQYVIAHSANHFGISHYLIAFGISRFGCNGNMLQQEITSGNSHITTVISPFVLIVQYNSVRCFIPQIIGTRKGNASQTALSYKFIIQQIKTIRYRNIANGIFISQQCFKISQGSRNFVPFGNNIQIIITRSQIYPPQHCHYHK